MDELLENLDPEAVEASQTAMDNPSYETSLTEVKTSDLLQRIHDHLANLPTKDNSSPERAIKDLQNDMMAIKATVANLSEQL
ncbi:unnamed protein product [Caretta caretta]